MKMVQSGFSIVESIVVIGIVAIVATFSFPFARKTLNEGTRDIAVRAVASQARLARAYAMDGKHDSDWGVYVNNAGVTVFSGTSYAARTSVYDETEPFHGSVTVSGTTEIIFAQNDGTTSGGTITILGPDGTSESLVVNTLGFISW